MADFTSYNTGYQVKINPYVPKGIKRKKSAEETVDDSPQPKKAKLTQENDTNSANKEKTSINYKSNNVNINSIVNDFRGTLNAIGAPEDVEKEVTTYLDLVDIQSQKQAPSKGIIKANLKSASQILDGYIGTTLNRDSTVVSTWIDSLLLQNVNFKAASPTTEQSENVTNTQQNQSNQVNQANSRALANITNVAKEAQTPETTSDLQSQTTVNTSIQPTVQENTNSQKTKKTLSPEVQQIRSLYKESQKYAVFGEVDKAISSSRKALKLADQTGNNKAKSIIHLNMGNIYEQNNNLPLALQNYNQSIKSAPSTGSEKILAESHYKMGLIYAQAGNDDVAVPHLYKALSYYGELDNG